MTAANRSLFFRGEHINLRALEPEDLHFLYELENNPALWSVGGTATPYSKYTLRHYITHGASDIYTDGQMRLAIETNETRHPVGTIDLINFEPRHRRAEVGIVILADERRKGYAGEAMRLMEDYAAHILRLRQLYAYVGTGNEASRRLFEKSGFCPLAELQDWVLTPDGYESVVLYQKLLKPIL